ncbi:hypothetical protein GJA_3571 [Janthinobacterium agaricidamnosum NBRC 102515 = DSM 9628]|uniref:Uncharacterized protein n=1 Tax=Janthinobacterium agaricidamnosum NBRC 102515 = DSM 9628 TaxID=1349767 RepID=W0V8H3_9BURK|nr:hypothetical protein GJA_3571 [Janthinobacterium agaricidamnosum NBRC 102515 = DSM 9628]
MSGHGGACHEGFLVDANRWKSLRTTATTEGDEDFSLVNFMLLSLCK